MRFALSLLVLLLVGGTARAQQLPTLPGGMTDPRREGDGGDSTRIPVRTSDTEVLGETSGSSQGGARGDRPIEAPVDPNLYICGPGDVFELDFWGQQNFQLKISVDLEGRAFIQKVGFVDVAGKTLAAVRTQVKKLVRSTYPGLKFDLVLASPRSFLVHIVENVKKPGTYATQPMERVSAVLDRAGGITGSRRRIAITHRDGTATTADLVRYELTGDVTANPYLLDGDVVRVQVPDVAVEITGPVWRPGRYELVGSKDLVELMTLAGGLKPDAATSLPIRVVRRNAKSQETYEEHAFSSGAAPAIALRDDDKVFIRSVAEYQRSVMLIGAVANSDNADAAAQVARLPYIEGDSVLTLIERAGGITASGDLRRAYISHIDDKGTTVTTPIDLEALLVRRDFNADRKIAMDDTIVIPPLQYSVRVEGAVARSGLYLFNPDFGIAEYIAHAGGRTRTAQDLDDSVVIDTAGKTRDYAPGLKLRPGDAILVPERSFSRPEIVQIVLAGAGIILSGVAITIAATR